MNIICRNTDILQDRRSRETSHGVRFLPQTIGFILMTLLKQGKSKSSFLQEREKGIAERDLENLFCYTSADVNWTIKQLLRERKIKREIIHFGLRKIAFASAL